MAKRNIGWKPAWFISLALFVAGMAYQLTPIPGPADACGFVSPPPAPTPGQIVISVSGRAERQLCGRVYMFAEAAPNVTDYSLKVEPTGLAMNFGPAYEIFAEAARQGQAPDIIVLTQWEMNDAARDGFLIPLEDCVRGHAEFAQVRADMWQWSQDYVARHAPALSNHTWGIPIDSNYRGLFYNKTMLGQMGWSQDEIDRFPERIRTGAITLEDLRAIAHAAVQKGVVQPNYAFWPDRLGQTALLMDYLAFGGRIYDSATHKLVIDKEPLRRALDFHRSLLKFRLAQPSFKLAFNSDWSDRIVTGEALAEGRVLFWVGDNQEWGNGAFDRAIDRGQQAYYYAHFGYALYPRAGSGKRPGVLFVEMRVAAIASNAARGGKNHQPAACALIAKTLLSEAYVRHISRSSTAMTIKSGPGTVRDIATRYALDSAYLRDYAWGDGTRAGELYDPVFDRAWPYLLEAETGSEADAVPIEILADQLLEQLKVALGSQFIVE